VALVVVGTAVTLAGLEAALRVLDVTPYPEADREHLR
jgi:hypothetical protein